MSNDSYSAPLEPREIQLRAFASREKQKKIFKQKHKHVPSSRVLVLDTETNTDAAQKMRFGVFQVRERGELFLHGLFYRPDVLSADEVKTLEAYAERNSMLFMTVAEFIEDIFFDECAGFDGLIVGYNLPYDLTRISIGYGTAKGGDRKPQFQDGFSLIMSESELRPRVRIKHNSARSAFIQFAAEKQPNQFKKDGELKKRERTPGFFLDVKTLAGALLAGSFTLERLCGELGVETKKRASENHGETLTDAYVDYAVKDVQATWECYDELCCRLDEHDLPHTYPHQLLSEASLGKAYLSTMGIKPWREAQPDFSPTRTGQIMSTYYGGRSEVHIRREVCETVYCDFLSMYPTVNALMGLWEILIADGIDEYDATDDARTILENWQSEDLLDQSNWQMLHMIVRVLPDDGIFPVRCVGGDALPRNESNRIANIGLNRLTCKAPLWCTLADCLVSKFLSGKSPNVVEAVGFTPRRQQSGLRSVSIAGNSAFRVDPAKDDFFKSVIELRLGVKAAKQHGTEKEKAKLDTQQQALKILANSTSYGIFVETNVRKLPKKTRFMRYGYDGIPTSILSKVEEKPGKFFHPLLATLITGAARLMLALAEHRAQQHGLDWVFCDTDGIAFAKPEGMSRSEFVSRAKQVCDWFKPLNPYDDDASILQLENENFAYGDKTNDLENAPPLYCYAVSAKRYALFNIGKTGVEIRKASAHGLGAYLPPYPNPTDGSWKQSLNTAFWQKEHWRSICDAALEGRDGSGEFIDDPRLDVPAASRCTITSPDKLKWFDNHNDNVPENERVWPFNFLLNFQCINLKRLAPSDPEAAEWLAKLYPQPKPSAPFDKSPARAAERAFDRDSGRPVPSRWLKTYKEVLQDYHLHSEAKFHGGHASDRGILWRRHIEAFAIRHIGKESHNWEDDYLLTPEGEKVIDHGRSILDVEDCVRKIAAAQAEFGVRALRDAAGVSDNTIRAICRVGDYSNAEAIKKLVRAAYVLREPQCDVGAEVNTISPLK